MIRYKLGIVDGVKGTGVFKNFRVGSFAELDTDDDGKISLSEFATGMKAQGMTKNEEIEAAFKAIDQDGTGAITHSEFIAAKTDAIITSSDVVVFVSSSCPYCAQAVNALEAEGIEVTVVERTPEMAAALLSKTGKASVPSAWVKGTYIGGCNDGPEDWMGVVPMVRSGKLSEMLSAA